MSSVIHLLSTGKTEKEGTPPRSLPANARNLLRDSIPVLLIYVTNTINKYNKQLSKNRTRKKKVKRETPFFSKIHRQKTIDNRQKDTELDATPNSCHVYVTSKSSGDEL